MEKEDFKRLESLGGDAIRLRNKLVRMRNASTVRATDYSSAGGRNGTGDLVGHMVCKMDEALQEFAATHEEMRRIVKTERDELMQRLLHLRFIEMLSWKKVADAMGYNDSAAVYRRFKRYRAKMTIDTTMKHDVK